MKIIGAAAVSGFMLMTLSGVQAQTPKIVNASQPQQVQSIEGGTTSSAPQSTQLFSIGGVGVHVWTQVEPPYNTNANRNRAANPLWEAETDPGQTAY